MKKITKHFLLLALMLFGAIGASWAQQHKLDSIPVNWQVKVGDAAPVSPTAYTVGNTQKGYIENITENDSVTLIPDNPRRVKSVTLEDAAVPIIINIEGITLDITGCTTWSDIIARNPGVIWAQGTMVESNTGLLMIGIAMVYISEPYDPAQQSSYHWQAM